MFQGGLTTPPDIALSVCAEQVSMAERAPGDVWTLTPDVAEVPVAGAPNPDVLLSFFLGQIVLLVWRPRGQTACVHVLVGKGPTLAVAFFTAFDEYAD